MVRCFDRHCRPRIPNNYNSLSYVLSDREDLCDFMRECRLQLLQKKKKKEKKSRLCMFLQCFQSSNPMES